MIAERFAIQKINPLLFTFFVYIILFAGYTILTSRSNSKISKSNLFDKKVVIIGLVSALGSISIFYSFSLAAASKVVTVKQSVIIFNIFIGALFFQEKQIARKLIGSLLIIAGILFVI